MYGGSGKSGQCYTGSLDPGWKCPDLAVSSTDSPVLLLPGNSDFFLLPQGAKLLMNFLPSSCFLPSAAC